MKRTETLVKALAAAAVLLLASGHQAMAAHFMDGNALVEKMRAYERVQQNAIPADREGMWTVAGGAFFFEGYVAGISDSYFSGSKCTDQNIKLAQPLAIVTKYLNDHPEKLSLPAATLVKAALREAFPCGKR